MILLDTNVVSETMKPAPNRMVRRWLDEQTAETLYLLSVTIAEVMFDIRTMPDGKRKQRLAQALDVWIGLFERRILPFDLNAPDTMPISALPLVRRGRDSRHLTATSRRLPPPGALPSRLVTPARSMLLASRSSIPGKLSADKPPRATGGIGQTGGNDRRDNRTFWLLTDARNRREREASA